MACRAADHAPYRRPNSPATAGKESPHPNAVHGPAGRRLIPRTLVPATAHRFLEFRTTVLVRSEREILKLFRLQWRSAEQAGRPGPIEPVDGGVRPAVHHESRAGVFSTR